MAPVTRSEPSDKALCTGLNTPPKDGAQSKPLGEFHYFPRLPVELRTMIWKMAIDPRSPRDTRGVHYSSLFKSAGDRESPLLPLAVTDRRLEWWEKKFRPSLLDIEHKAAAPRVTTCGARACPPEYSWFKDNRSLYAWNAGLLDACQESRWITSMSTKGTPNPDRSESVIKARDKGASVSLRVYEHDLFCLEFEREDIKASM